MHTENIKNGSENQAEQLKSYINRMLLKQGESESAIYVRNKLKYLKSLGEIKNIDDFCQFFFEGERRYQIKYYKNTDLVNELIVTFFWHRIHRHGLWHQIGEVFAPSVAGFNKINAILDRVQNRLDLHPVIDFLRAGVHCAFQNWDEAEKLFSHSPYPKHAAFSDFFRGATTYKNPYRAIDFSLDSFDLNNLFDIKSDDLQEAKRDKAIPIVIFSCDRNYFEQFSERVVHSAVESGFYCDFLFFIIGEDIDQLPTEIKLKKFVQDKGRNMYTIKAVSKKQELPAIAACGRYLIAGEVISRVGSGVFIFDIDFEFKPGMIEELNRIANDDSIGLCFNKYGRNIFPWASVPAASTYVPNTEAGLKMLNIFSIYIQKHFRESGGNWWIDQNALFTAYHLVRRMFPQQKFSNLVEIRNVGATNADTSVQHFKKQNVCR
jgi:hypothetical protein